LGVSFGRIPWRLIGPGEVGIISDVERRRVEASTSRRRSGGR